MVTSKTGTFIVDSGGQVKVNFLFDGGWFRGELAIFSLAGMEEFTPGTTDFMLEAARRALTDSEQGRIILQDELEGAKLNADLAWERNFNTGEYQAVKTFTMTPGDEVGLMLVQHTTIQETYDHPDHVFQFGKLPIFSIPEANLLDSSPNEFQVVDVDGQGTIAFEDVPIQGADRDYNDLILNLQGVESNLASLKDNLNPDRNWQDILILEAQELEGLSDEQFVMHLEFDDISGNISSDSSPRGENNPGKFSNGAEFSNGIVELNGNNDIIEVGDSQDINLGNHSKRTISIWFKVDNKNLANSKQIIYEEGGITGGDAGLNIYVENGRIYFGGWNRDQGNWAGTYLSSDAIYSNTWHHAVLVLDAESGVDTIQESAFRAYLDGEQVDVGEGIELTTHPDNIGLGGLNETTRFHNGVGQINDEYSLAGSLEDIRLYNRALSESEISFLFNPNHKPIAINDKAVTVENTAVILFGSSLVANDTDLDGNLLSLISVDNAINGTINTDPQGNVIFTPEPNFSGDASFEYVVSDGQGETDSATVTVTVLPARTSIPIGTNLHPLADWSPQLPFLNALKSARQWLTQHWVEPIHGWHKWHKIVWDTGEFDQLDLDENGWVKSLPAPEDGAEYNSVGTIIFRNVGHYPAGKYVVLYEGEGTIEYGLDARKDELASSPGRDVIDVNPTNAGIWLRIMATDPHETGNYLRNIQVLPEEYEYAEHQVFNPEFLEKIQPFDTIRFMDWMETNNSHQGEWSERPTPDNSIFFGGVASVEDMVELANRTNTNPWFNMPHQATDEYVTNFANYVRDNLDPELKVYVEYSNEVWGGFAQGWWVEQQGKAEFADSPAGNFAKRMDWFSKRTTEITQIWDEVYGEEKERVIGVMGVQAANLWTGRRALDYAWTDNPLSHEEYGIDAIGIGPYFGRYLGKPHFASQMEAWLDSDDSNLALDNLFQEITEGGVLQHAPAQGALQEAYDWTKNYVTLAESQDLDLLAYEGSQHITGIHGTQYNQAIGDLFIAANRDPRMGEIYQEYFTTLHELGVDLSINHIDVSRYNQHGSWGSIEYISQEDAPKYNALKSLTANNHLPPQLGRLEHNLSRSLGIIVEGDTLYLSADYTDVGVTDYHTVEFNWGDDSPIDQEEHYPLLGDLGRVANNHVYSGQGNYTATLTITDHENLMAQKSLSVKVAKKVEINWRPNSPSQEVNLAGDGEVSVAVLGTENFDVAELDSTSVRADDQKDVLLNGEGITPIDGQSRLEDVNEDGFQDLVVAFGKSDLSSAIATNSDLSLSEHQIYLFGSSSALDSGFFFGTEPVEDSILNDA